MGKGYNNYMTKKPFHPGSKANIKRTWMAEQRTENEKRKQEELKVQYEKEQDLYNNRALLSTESKDKLELNFMYEAPPGAKRERQKEDDEPEYKFEWQRKYNAPREDYAKGNADIRDQPFGIPVRNVRCIKCHKWGHINTDKECPLFNSSSASSMPTTSMDPLELMRQMREDGYNLKQNVLGHHVNPRLANQQYVHSDDEDNDGGEEDPEMEFLKSLTSKQKKKLLKKLNKLSKKQKKKEAAKKKKQKERKMSDSDSEEEPKKKTKKKKDETSEHSELSSGGEMQQPDVPASTRDRSLHKSKRRHKEEDAEDTVEPKKGKRSHPSGESKGDNRSATSKHNASKQDEKRHKRKKDSRKHKKSDSSSSSSEGDDYRRAKKRLPDTAVDVDKPEKLKNEDTLDDDDDDGVSSSKRNIKKHDSNAPECKKDKKKGKHDSHTRGSDSLSSPEKEKRSHKEKPLDDNSGQKPSAPIRNYDDKDHDVLQHPNSNKKESPSSHKNLDDGSSTSKEGTAESKKTSGSPIKSEKTRESVQKTETAEAKKSVHPKEASARPSTSKQCEPSSEDDEGDDTNFVKPSKSSSSQNKSHPSRRISPEHPDGFSHEFPQRKSSGKEPEEAGISNLDPKYFGNTHDRFRDLHRHRRSPSIKHKYQS